MYGGKKGYKSVEKEPGYLGSNPRFTNNFLCNIGKSAFLSGYYLPDLQNRSAGFDSLSLSSNYISKCF